MISYNTDLLPKLPWEFCHDVVFQCRNTGIFLPSSRISVSLRPINNLPNMSLHHIPMTGLPYLIPRTTNYKLSLSHHALHQKLLNKVFSSIQFILHTTNGWKVYISLFWSGMYITSFCFWIKVKSPLVLKALYNVHPSNQRYRYSHTPLCSETIVGSRTAISL